MPLSAPALATDWQIRSVAKDVRLLSKGANLDRQQTLVLAGKALGRRIDDLDDCTYLELCEIARFLRIECY